MEKVDGRDIWHLLLCLQLRVTIRDGDVQYTVGTRIDCQLLTVKLVLLYPLDNRFTEIQLKPALHKLQQLTSSPPPHLPPSQPRSKYTMSPKRITFAVVIGNLGLSILSTLLSSYRAQTPRFECEKGDRGFISQRQVYDFGVCNTTLSTCTVNQGSSG